MKRIILIGLILFCMAAVASADLGPVVVNEGKYQSIFDDEVYADLTDDFVVAMVEGGEWIIISYPSGDSDNSKELDCRITTQSGEPLVEGSKDEFGRTYVTLPASLEIGKEYKLVYTYGEKNETFSFKVISAEEAGLSVERGNLEITGFEDGEVLKPVKSKYSDTEWLHIVYNQCGFGIIKVTVEGSNWNGSIQLTENCSPTGDGKNQDYTLFYDKTLFKPGESYRITFEQGDQTVSKAFGLQDDSAPVDSMGSSSAGIGVSDQESKPKKEKKFQDAISAAFDSVLSQINGNNDIKKKNITLKTEKGSFPKTFYYKVNEANGGIPLTATDCYLNDEFDYSLSSAVRTLTDEVEYLKKFAEYPDEIYIFPEYTYTVKRETYSLTVIPFYAKKDGSFFGDNMYLYGFQQSKGDYKSGGKKYTMERLAFIIADEYHVKNILYSVFSDSTYKTWRDYVNGFSTTISPELMEKAVPATEIDNQIVPIGTAVIRKDADVRVRVSPEMDAEVIGIAKKGTTYLLYSVENNDWLKIKMEDGSFGYIDRWMCTKYTDSSDGQIEEADQATIDAKETPEQSGTKDASEQKIATTDSSKSDAMVPGNSDTDGSVKGILIKHKVGLREKAEKNGKRIRVLDRGTEVDVIGKTSNGEGLWYYVQVNKDKGYLPSEMLEVKDESGIPEL